MKEPHNYTRERSDSPMSIAMLNRQHNLGTSRVYLWDDKGNVTEVTLTFSQYKINLDIPEFTRL